MLGLRYAALFPANIRAITIDGVVDPTQDLTGFLHDQTIAFDQALTAELDTVGLTATLRSQQAPHGQTGQRGAPVGVSSAGLAASGDPRRTLVSRQWITSSDLGFNMRANDHTTQNRR